MTAQRPAMHAGEAVAEALCEEGVERVFSVPGSHIHPIYDGISRIPSIRMVTCKMEPNASLMADAYGRLTGKPGICIVTAGPGCVNSMAGVAQAYGAASPVVHIGGAVPLNSPLEPFHGANDPAFVHEMFKSITKWTMRVERLAEVPEAMAKAFHIARSGRPGPVHVELPRVADYSEFILQEKPEPLPAYKPIPATVMKPDPQDVDRFAERLMDAKRPVIAAGKGVIRAGAIADLAALAEQLQAPVVFAQDTIGVISEDHPLSAGFISEIQPHPLCAAVLKDADVVLCVGMRMGAAEMVALTTSVPEDKLMVAGYDDRKTELYRGDFRCVTDSKLFFEALARRLGNFHAASKEATINMLADGKAEIRRKLAAQNAPHKTDTPIFPRHPDGRHERGARRRRRRRQRCRQLPDVAAPAQAHRDAGIVHAVGRVERHELRPANRHGGQARIPRTRRDRHCRRWRLPDDLGRPADGGRIRRQYSHDRAEQRHVRADVHAVAGPLRTHLRH